MATSSSPSSKISLKLLINKKSRKVLFAEANKDFVDFLFRVFSLPLGTVTRLLKKNSMAGSLGKLYASIENLNDTYMQPNQTKNAILNPKIANYAADHFPLLLLVDDVSMAMKFYTCPNHSQKTTGSSYRHHKYGSIASSSEHFNVATDPTTLCPKCKVCMNSELSYVAGAVDAEEMEKGGGFVKGVVTYMVMDDLEVKPMSSISSIAMLKKFKVKEVSDLEEKVVSLDTEEGLKLLKASLHCDDVLTTTFMA